MENVTFFEIEVNYIAILNGFISDNKHVAILYKNLVKFDINDVLSLNKDVIVNTIKQLIADASSKVKNINLSNIYLMMPPKNCTSYQSRVETLITSPDFVVRDGDIKNLFNMASKKLNDNNQDIIEIVPDHFETSDGNKSINPPLNKVSREIRMAFKFHCIDKKTNLLYDEIFSKAKLNIAHKIISTIDLPSLIKNDYSKLENYFLFFIKENVTTITLVGGNKSIKTDEVNFGIANLVLMIMEKYNITYVDAKSILANYGFDKSEYKFKFNLYKDDSVKILQKDLNLLILKFLENLKSEITKQINIISSCTNLSFEQAMRFNFIFMGSLNNVFNISPLIGQIIKTDSIFFSIKNANVLEYQLYDCYSGLYSLIYKKNYLELSNIRNITNLKRGD